MDMGMRAGLLCLSAPRLALKQQGQFLPDDAEKALRDGLALFLQSSKIDRLSIGDCVDTRILPKEISSSIIIPSIRICSLRRVEVDCTSSHTLTIECILTDAVDSSDSSRF